MSSIVSICNRGLQILGAARILDITEDTRNGRACNACYDVLRKSELRKHRWRFAIARKVLAPLTGFDDPHEEFSYVFQMPADCLRILKPEDVSCDWQVEGRRIYTNETDALNLRYIKDETDTNVFDECFSEMLSAKLAEAMCEEITQSNSKKAEAKDNYKTARSEARQMNAFETIPAEPQDDPWVTARITG